MKNIAVLGSKGMLGRYVYTYLNQSGEFNVDGISREQLDFEFASLDQIEELLKGYDVVVNCIGVIKPMINNEKLSATVKINSWLPHAINDLSKKMGFGFIHITTDCVFSGKNDKPYNELQYHDPEDFYGKSKSLGEPTSCTTIRTSIIGEEIGDGRSLLSWAISQKGKTVNGFTDHYWNGVTCLQLAKLIEQIINENNFNLGVFHYFSQTISKDILLSIINQVYNLDLTIQNISAPNGSCNRALDTCKHTAQYSIQVPSLSEQISQLKEFKLDEGNHYNEMN